MQNKDKFQLLNKDNLYRRQLATRKRFQCKKEKGQ